MHMIFLCLGIVLFGDACTHDLWKPWAEMKLVGLLIVYIPPNETIGPPHPPIGPSYINSATSETESAQLYATMIDEMK